MGSYCVTQGTQPHALWPPGGVGWQGWRLNWEAVYVYVELTHIVV